VTNALRLRKFKVKYKQNEEEIKMDKNTKIITIEGMQCNHCKMSVEKALNAIEEVAKVEVNLQNKTATVELLKDLDNNKLTEVIQEAGFTVIEIN